MIAPEELVGEEWLHGIAFHQSSVGANRILKVLSLIRVHRVHSLLIGGQACVFYGAAEFSRDTDLAILASSENLARLKKALKDLQAEVIAVPPFEAKYLRKGHAA